MLTKPITVPLPLAQLDQVLRALSSAAPLILALIKAPNTISVDDQRLYLLPEDTDHHAVLARQAFIAALLGILDAMRPHVPASTSAKLDAVLQSTMLDRPH